VVNGLNSLENLNTRRCTVSKKCSASTELLICDAQNVPFVNNMGGTVHLNFIIDVRERTFKMEPGAFVFAKIRREVYA
jgi:hypothetical protein